MHSLSLLLYRVFLILYPLGVKIVAVAGNVKAKKWIAGRKNAPIIPDKKNTRVWMHCASVGEFEQGRPIIENIKTNYPHAEVILTFFSPSGFEVYKNFPLATAVAYLPLDHPQDSFSFVSTLSADVALFVKYDHWYYYLNALQISKTPTILISALFRKEQLFFKWYGSLYREMLRRYSKIFVQNQDSVQLLKSINIKNVVLAGDTRYDRVVAIASAAQQLEVIEYFLQGQKAIIAGSTWPEDEKILSQVFNQKVISYKWIIVPHEIHQNRIAQVQKLFPNALLYSQFLKNPSLKGQVLIVDQMGLLSRMYRYGIMAWVGGGFNSGIHNILEPAAFGLPIIFGPQHEKFLEAQEMRALEFAHSVQNEQEAVVVMKKWLENPEQWQIMQNSLLEWIKAKTGASTQIMKYLKTILPKP